MKSSEQAARASAHARGKASGARARRPAQPVSTALVLVATLAGTSRADDPAEAMREGLRSYGQGEFDKARDRFAAAREQFDGRDAAKCRTAAFDQACAAHRKGDAAQAREWYLKAGLAHDKELAASAHFNLGSLAAEEANTLAGEHPENVAPEKRQEILDQLKAAVASFRHCLDLQPENSHARRDIELVRQWIKYYGDRWQARDREQRRQETNLVAFLEFLIETERALREAVKALATTSPADAFAEPKRQQEELQQEIPALKEKIRSELAPQQSGGGSTPPGNSPELEQGIALLQGWADAAGDKMSSAARHLGGRQAQPAGSRPTIRDRRTGEDLGCRDPVPCPACSRSGRPDAHRPISRTVPPPRMRSQRVARLPVKTIRSKVTPSLQAKLHRRGPVILRSGQRAKIWRRSRKLRSGRSVERNCSSSRPRANWHGWRSHGPTTTQGREQDSATGKSDPPDAKTAKPQSVDPKQLKEGYQQAIKLAPRAIEQMERAINALKQKNPQAAYPPAEEARKILEEIQKAQPRNDQQDKQKQDQNKKNEEQEKQDQKKQQQQDQQKEKEDRQQQETAKAKTRKRRSGKSQTRLTSRNVMRKTSSLGPKSHAIGSRKRCARSANGSRKSGNETVQ